MIRVPDDTLPGDLDITADIAQHWMASAEKACRQLGWRHADPEECICRSVQWHLKQACPIDEDFIADDRALAAA